MRGQFLQLYKKEIRESLTAWVIFGVLTIGWLIFLHLMKDMWGREEIFALSFIPVTLLPFYTVLAGLLSFRGEWRDDTVFALMSLPVPGWFFTGSKYLATMTGLLLMSLLNLIGTAIVSLDLVIEGLASIPMGVGHHFRVWLALIMFYIFCLLMCGVGYLVGQFSYLVSRLVNRFGAVITGVTFLVSIWFIIRVSGVLALGLTWLPDFTFKSWNIVNGVYHTEVVGFESAPWVALLLVVAGLSYVGSWIFDRVLEV